MTTKGQRIEHIKNQKGLSYNQLASLIGNVSGDAIRKAIQRDNLKEYYINILSDKLGINKNWIETGEGEIYVQSKNVQINETISIDGHEVSFKSVERAVFDNKEDFLREGGVLQLLIKNEAYELFLKTLKENNISFQQKVE